MVENYEYQFWGTKLIHEQGASMMDSDGGGGGVNITRRQVVFPSLGVTITMIMDRMTFRAIEVLIQDLFNGNVH